MSEATKACNLTEKEIKILINHHGYNLAVTTDYKIERINYLNKRLNTFKEPEEKQSDETKNNAATGWPTNG